MIGLTLKHPNGSGPTLTAGTCRRWIEVHRGKDARWTVALSRRDAAGLIHSRRLSPQS